MLVSGMGRVVPSFESGLIVRDGLTALVPVRFNCFTCYTVIEMILDIAMKIIDNRIVRNY